MRYFDNIHTLEDLKKAYRNYAKMYHPDLGGSEEVMAAINAEYDVVFEKVKNNHKTAEGKTYTKETTETPEMFRDIINAIINFNCDIEIIGTWVWCFNSYEYKDQLKALGFKYAPKRKAWCWHSDEFKSRKSNMTTDEMRAKYGSQSIRNKEDQQLLAQ